ncbi:hypothetical protein [Nisaea sp.]|uniref:hypothetical protein n=1 Tax=Nisaea sp. TaxID=2024842 RepID=UPI002B272743|nr:hypothetical protein [Nisaea sp.]
MICSVPILAELYSIAALVPDDFQKWNSSNRDNLVTRITHNKTWYAKKQISAEELYVDAPIN